MMTETEAGLDPLPVGALQGLTAGALLYTLLFRVLARERLKSGPGLLQVLAVFIGFSLILIVEIFGRNYNSYKYNYNDVQDTRHCTRNRRCWGRRRMSSIIPSLHSLHSLHFLV